jgi:hypothetical protein
MSGPIVAHDPYSYKPDAPCPKCGVQVTFTSPPTVRCRACGWAVDLMPAESSELTFAWGGIDRGLNLRAFLAEIATRTSPLPEPPPKVLSCKPTPTTHNAVVLPEGTETPTVEAERLSDQFYLNGGELTRAHGQLIATSQERDDANAPRTRYVIGRVKGVWMCECRAGQRRICAHRAGYRTHLIAKLSDPDVTLTADERAHMTTVLGELDRQFGIFAPKPARSAEEVQARAAAAMSDLFGQVA